MYMNRDEQFAKDSEELQGYLEPMETMEIWPDSGDDTVRYLERRDEAIAVLRGLIKEMYEWLVRWECECYEMPNGCGRCLMLGRIGVAAHKVKEIDGS